MPSPLPAPGAPRELLQLLARYDERVRELTLALRALLHRELAPCFEFVYDMRSKLVLIYSASDRVIADGICQVPVFARHVTLVFPQGVDMADPSQLLRGSGKVMRHVRIEQLAEVDRPEIRRLLREARKIAGPNRRSPGQAAGVVTSFRRTSPASRVTARRKTVWPDRLF